MEFFIVRPVITYPTFSSVKHNHVNSQKDVFSRRKHEILVGHWRDEANDRKYSQSVAATRRYVAQLSKSEAADEGVER
jgi:hypothetical protein